MFPAETEQSKQSKKPDQVPYEVVARGIYHPFHRFGLDATSWPILRRRWADRGGDEE
jgi:hypothetical protein